MLYEVITTFISPVPVFLMSVGLEPSTSMIPNVMALTMAELCGASNGSVSSNRITSYNVCYTKLLRLAVELLAWRNCFTHPDREERMTAFVNKSKK